MAFCCSSNQMENFCKFAILFLEGNVKLYPSYKIHSAAIHPVNGTMLYNPFFSKDYFLFEMNRVKGINYPAYNTVPPYVAIVFHELGHVYGQKVSKKRIKRARKMIKKTTKYSKLLQKNLKIHFFLEKEIIADVWANDFIKRNYKDIMEVVEKVEKFKTDEIMELIRG